MRRILLVLAILTSGTAVLTVSPAAVAVPAGGPVPTAIEAIPGDGVVTLTWRLSPDAADEVTGYRIYRDGERVAEVTEVSAPVYTDTGLANGDRLRYEVSAVTAAGEGAR